jgi:hypothetical protein
MCYCYMLQKKMKYDIQVNHGHLLEPEQGESI